MDNLLEELQVVTIDDLSAHLNTSKENATVYIHRLIGKNKAEKIRKGLYYIKPGTNSLRPPNRYLLAAKIAPDATICYHSALELHGIAHQVFYKVFVHSEKRFNPFTYRSVSYHHVDLKSPEFDVAELDLLGQKVRYTSLERTILDCTHYLKFSGGWDEFYNSLNTQITVNLIKMFTDTFNVYQSKNTYRKVGFLLDLFKHTWNYDKKLFLSMKKVVQNQYIGSVELQRTRVFSDTLKKNYELEHDHDWNIIFPRINNDESEYQTLR